MSRDHGDSCGETTMAYTVKKLATVSGVSVRTLHYYDEIGLLKPAYCGANGYRFYEDEQVLRLQQILFYREFGLGLKQIQGILGRSKFDKVAALESHRSELLKELDRKQQLITTIEKTIQHLQGTTNMDNKALFEGFDPKQQEEHEQYLIKRFGGDMKQNIAKSNKRVKDWSKQQWERTKGDFARICADLVTVMETPLEANSDEAQKLIRQHFDWLSLFWTPDRASYVGYGQLIQDSELRNAYTAHHAELPTFVAQAISAFAERELK